MPEKRYDRVRLPLRAAPVRRSQDRAREPARAETRPPGNDGLRALLLRLERGRVHRAGRGAAFTAAPNVEQALERGRGGGQPLPGRLRERMESAFGASFEEVTIHTGGEADALTRQVDAVAFTHGSDIYFSDGAYAPDTSPGQRLLAHELTHVVQQHSGRKVTVGAAYDPAESEADAVADAVVQRLQAVEPAATAPPVTVARQAQPEEEEDAQWRQRQADDDERVQPLRRQEEEDRLAPPIRRSTSVTVASVPAVTSAEMATEEQPRDAELYGQAVQAYREGDLRRALELFHQVLDIDQAAEGRRASAIWNIGRIHQDMGNDRAALTMYRTYLAQPTAPDERRAVAQRIVADLERKLGPAGGPAREASPEEGDAGQEPPVESLPTLPEQRAQALYGLASQSYQSGDFATALEHFQQLMRTGGLEQRIYTETLYNMAQCHRRMGSNGAAIDLFRGFLQQPDATPEARQRTQRLIAMLQY